MDSDSLRATGAAAAAAAVAEAHWEVGGLLINPVSVYGCDLACCDLTGCILLSSEELTRATRRAQYSNGPADALLETTGVDTDLIDCNDSLDAFSPGSSPTTVLPEANSWLTRLPASKNNLRHSESLSSAATTCPAYHLSGS